MSSSSKKRTINSVTESAASKADDNATEAKKSRSRKPAAAETGDKDNAASASNGANKNSSAAKVVKDKRLQRDFFAQPCEALAKALLGKILVRVLPNGSVLKGRIVEVEAYLGGDDKASHSYSGKRTGWASNKAMFMEAGTAYVFSIFGKYDSLNVSSVCEFFFSQEQGGAVRIRSLEPLASQKEMEAKELCNGPARLCQAFKITKAEYNQKDLTDYASDLYFEEDGFKVEAKSIVAAARIGLPASAGEWIEKPLRFFIKGNPFVSESEEK